MLPVAWRAWDQAATVYDSVTTQWDSLPPLGLQVVIVYYDEFDLDTNQRYRRVMHGTNFYYMTNPQNPAGDGSTFGQNDDSLIAQREAIASSLKTGTQIPDPLYLQLLFAGLGTVDVPKPKDPPPPPPPDPKPTVDPVPALSPPIKVRP